MKKEDVKYGAYVQILKEELVPAMGCLLYTSKGERRPK